MSGDRVLCIGHGRLVLMMTGTLLGRVVDDT